jgi:hypothetical protein
VRIDTELNVIGTFNEYGPPKIIRVYKVDGDDVILPFAFWKKLEMKGKQYPNHSLHKPKTNIEFVGTLRPEQSSVIEEASEYLRTNRSLLLNLPCNFGKTCLSIYIASQLTYHVCVISANSIKLLNQWFERINDFAPDAKVEKVTGKTEELDLTCQFHVCTATTLSKKSASFFEPIGLFVVDEVHKIATSCFALGLQHVRPKFAIGMTATLDRDDGMDKVIYAHFGKARVKREDVRYFCVFSYFTGIKLEFDHNARGRMDWSSVLKSQAQHPVRNEMIIRMVRHFPEKVILILCKLIDHCKILEAMLSASGEEVTSIYGSTSDYDHSKRIIVATFSKMAIGVDDRRISLVLFASDQIDVEQSKGRCRCAFDDFPEIVDIVDNLWPLIKHYNQRAVFYHSRNCDIVPFEKAFPDFVPPDEMMEWHNRKRKSNYTNMELPERLTESRAKLKGAI